EVGIATLSLKEKPMPEIKPQSTTSAGRVGDPRVDPFDVYKPTPTQEENDRAAVGEHVTEKEPDGSPEQESSAPVASGYRSEQREHRQQRSQEHQRAQEAKRPSGSYETRTVQPRPQAAQHSPSAEKKDS